MIYINGKNCLMLCLSLTLSPLKWRVCYIEEAVVRLCHRYDVRPCYWHPDSDRAEIWWSNGPIRTSYIKLDISLNLQTIPIGTKITQLVSVMFVKVCEQCLWAFILQLFACFLLFLKKYYIFTVVLIKDNFFLF